MASFNPDPPATRAIAASPQAALRRRLLTSSQPSDIMGLLAQGAWYDLSNTVERERVADAFTRAAAFGNIPAMEALAEAGAHLDWPAPRQSARTALIYALEHGDTETGLATVRWLLSRGADANKASGDQETPLIIAAAFGREEALAALIEHGARVDRTDARGRSPLRRAAECGQAETARLLLQAGADPDALGADGTTPADWAASDDVKTVFAAFRALAEREELDTGSAPARPAPRL